MITVLVRGFFFLIPAVAALLVEVLVLETTTFFGALDESLSLMCFSQTGLTTSGFGFVLDGQLLKDKLSYKFCLPNVMPYLVFTLTKNVCNKHWCSIPESVAQWHCTMKQILSESLFGWCICPEQGNDKVALHCILSSRLKERPLVHVWWRLLYLNSQAPSKIFAVAF